jgi:hypothetical protein
MRKEKQMIALMLEMFQLLRLFVALSTLVGETSSTSAIDT